MVQREKGRKSRERKQGTRTARGKRKGTGIWTETEKKKQQGHRKRHRKIDQDSGRMEMEENTLDGQQDRKE